MTTNQKTLNLEFEAAKISQQLVDAFKKARDNRKIKKLSEAGTVVQNAMGVLQEQSLYAMFLYLYANGKEPGKHILHHTTQFLNLCFSESWFNVSEESLNSSMSEVLNALNQNICQDVDKTLFARSQLERLLTYTRYHLKGLD